jgi:hypothetical protein
MSSKGNGFSPALKHGAYAKAALLPGEDPVEFNKLHKGLIAEFRPNGRMEEETVASIARLMWRRQNLADYENTQLAQYTAEWIKKGAAQAPTNSEDDKEFLAEVERLIEPYIRPPHRASKKRVRTHRELPAGDLVEVSKVAILNRLTKELDVEERLDAMIDKLIKRLLFVRGLKSISSSEAMASPYSAGKSLPRIQPS